MFLMKVGHFAKRFVSQNIDFHKGFQRFDAVSWNRVETLNFHRFFNGSSTSGDPLGPKELPRRRLLSQPALISEGGGFIWKLASASSSKDFADFLPRRGSKTPKNPARFARRKPSCS